MDGKIIIGGSFTTYNGVAGNRIARLNPNGSIDTTFNPGTGANVDVTATAVQGDGKIVFGGNFTSYNGVARNGIARASGDLFVTWAAGDATNKALLLPIVDDSLVEGNETLTLTLTSVAGGATLGAISTQTLTILDNDQSITFGPLSNKNFGDPPFTLNATASSGLPVSFQVIAGPATINGNALTITGVGTVTVRALQTGNSSYNAANPVDQSFVIFRGNQTIAFDPLTDKTFGNAPFIVSALASSGLPVSFQILSGPATVTGHTVTITGPGLVTVRASQSGDANYNAASPVDRSFLVSEPTGLPVITSPLTASSLVGQQFTYQFEATGATSLTVSNLPPGLTFSTALSAIVGSPTAVGVFQVELAASNAGGTTTATLTITVSSRPSSGPVILSSSSATGRTGQPFNLQIIATDKGTAQTITASALPTGLTIDALTGLISGASASDTSTAVTLTVTDGNLTTSSILELTFSSDLARPVIISPSSTTVAANQFFSYTIDAPANSDPSDPTVFTLIGTLPAGLTFDSQTGTISGTFTGNNLRRRPSPNLSGGIVTNVQLFATNSHGTSTLPLVFFLAPAGTVNISTRLAIGTGDNVLIAGFIITGNAPKKVMIRALGPSLTVPGAVQDTTLELHDADVTLGSNDNWRETQENEIIATTIAPSDDRESAIVAILNPGNYSAVVRGKNDATGIAVVEAYDLGTASLDNSSNSKLANIATRGPVLGGDNVMIGGFIVSRQDSKVVVRATGPSLSAFGIAGTLQDPTLALKDANGLTLIENDDWQQGQPADIEQVGLAPTDPRESALIATLAPGQYTAIVSGKDDTTGVALVEVYGVQ